MQVRQYAIDRGYRAVMYIGHSSRLAEAPSGQACPEFFEDLQTSRVLGVATIATPLHAAWVDRIPARNIPRVGSFSVQRALIIPGFIGMVCQGLRYLIELGRYRLAVLSRVHSSDNLLDMSNPARNGQARARYGGHRGLVRPCRQI